MESADFVTTGAIMVHPLNIKPEIISNKKGKILFDGVFMVKALLWSSFYLFGGYKCTKNRKVIQTFILLKVLVVVFPKLL